MSIQEALDKRLAEMKTLEKDLKQEYDDLKKVCNPIPEEDIHGFMFGLLKVGRERTNAYKRAYEGVLELHQRRTADIMMREQTSQLICCKRRRENQEVLPNQRMMQEELNPLIMKWLEVSERCLKVVERIKMS